MSLTPNVKYLVHVVTMPGLKSRIHVMGLASIPVESFPGLDFDRDAIWTENVMQEDEPQQII